MPIINSRTREVNCKIVYCGPRQSGKTTNVRSLYRMLPSKDKSEMQLARSRDEQPQFDYFSINLPQIKGMKVRYQVYTAPGEDFQKEARKMVLQDVDGIVFVADSSAARLHDNLAALADVKAALLEQSCNYAEVPFVIQYNKRDVHDAMDVEHLNRQLNDRDWATVEAVAKENRGVAQTFKAICAVVFRKMNDDLQVRA